MRLNRTKVIVLISFKADVQTELDGFIIKTLSARLKEAIEKSNTAIKTKLNGNVVLDSRLLPIHPHDGWKWISHRPRPQ